MFARATVVTLTLTLTLARTPGVVTLKNTPKYKTNLLPLFLLTVSKDIRSTPFPRLSSTVDHRGGPPPPAAPPAPPPGTRGPPKYWRLSPGGRRVGHGGLDIL